jgi:hypothetical protein
VHATTRHIGGRPIILGAVYASFLLVWPLMVMTVVGVAETLFDLRGRFDGRGPPTARAT